MMTLTSPRVGAALLVVAGIYQLTPLKRVCLQKCQSPLGFLMHHWRAGVGGAFRMGIDHGVVLPRMLLGADAAAVCRRRDEPRGHRRADRVCGLREAQSLRHPQRRASAACCWSSGAAGFSLAL